MRPLIIALALWMAATTALAVDEPYGSPPPDLARHLARLKDAYPDVIKSYDKTKLVLYSGAKLPISDGRTDKTFAELLGQPDIDDMFAIPYPAHAEPRAPEVNSDPARIRVEALFRAIYGDCRKGGVTPDLRSPLVRRFRLDHKARRRRPGVRSRGARPRQTAEPDDEISRTFRRDL